MGSESACVWGGGGGGGGGGGRLCVGGEGKDIMFYAGYTQRLLNTLAW